MGHRGPRERACRGVRGAKPLGLRLGSSPCLRACRRPVRRELRPASRCRRLWNRHCRRAHRHGRWRPDDPGARALLQRAAAHRGFVRPRCERGDEAGGLAGASAAWHRPSGAGEVAVRRIGSGGLRRGARGARTRRRRTGAVGDPDGAGHRPALRGSGPHGPRLHPPHRTRARPGRPGRPAAAGPPTRRGPALSGRTRRHPRRPRRGHDVGRIPGRSSSSR